MEVNGTRNTVLAMQQNLENSIKMNLIQQHPQNAKNINKYIEFMDKKMPTFEDILKIIIQIYKNYLTVDEIQELNKFYSTEVMQKMVAKTPLMMQEFAPKMVDMINSLQTEIMEYIRHEENYGEKEDASKNAVTTPHNPDFKTLQPASGPDVQ
jgi:hypothetical protein